MRVVVFAGKGGVGKTTTAAATALHAAQRGLKTLVVSADPDHALADVLDRPLGPEPEAVAAGAWALQADPVVTAGRLWGLSGDVVLDALDGLGLDPLGPEDLTGLPGLDDLLALLAVHDQVRGGPWDLVVVDTAGAAQTFRQLTAPARTSALLTRLLPMERRIDRLADLRGAVDPLVALADRGTAELSALRAMLAGPSTSVRLVLTPEAVVLAGTRRLFTALVMSGFGVDAVLANRVREGDHAQAAVLTRAAGAFGAVPVLPIAERPEGPCGVAQLSALGREELPDTLVDASPDRPPEPFEIDRCAEGFRLRIRIPSARRQDVDLARRGDDLVIEVEGYRQVLELPGALRRCQIAGATLREGTLAVAFTPDPAEFPDRWR